MRCASAGAGVSVEEGGGSQQVCEAGARAWERREGHHSAYLSLGRVSQVSASYDNPIVVL